MNNDLSELIERVEFCRQKSAALSAEVVKLGEVSIRHWLVPWQPGTGEIKAKLLAHPTVGIRQEIGMIVNEQRSILDALACTLAKRNGANHTNDVYFPITKTKSGFYENLGRRKIKKLSAQNQLDIENLKPWMPGEEDEEDGNMVVFQLHEADRIRKHQNLLKWACIGGAFPAGNGHIGHMQTGPVVFREIDKEETLAFFSGVTCQLRVTFDLVYSEPGALDGHAVAPLITAFNEKISDIVSTFT